MESLAKVSYGLKKTKVSCVTTRRSPENHNHQKDIVPVSLKISQKNWTAFIIAYKQFTGPLLG